jgi:glycosyltransferase involved in cell wall biosynthesis
MVRTLAAPGGVSALAWRNGARNPRGALRFWRGLPRRHWRIVHIHFGGRSVRWLSRHLADNPKIVVHLHGYLPDSLEPVSSGSAITGADAVVAVSQAAASLAWHPRTFVIHPGVPIFPERPRLPEGRARKIIGTAGRLVPIKGILHLIRAMPVICAAMPEARLEIAGDGPDRPALQQEVHRLGLASSVALLAWQSDLAPLFARWDVFVQPSLSEGLPLSLIEVMEAGIPVVATGIGGVGEAIVDGHTGFLAPAADSAALASRVLELLHDADLRHCMGAAGRHRVQKCFSVGRMVTAIADLYTELLA